MENKYYTPELDEFHIGFEYESLIDYYKEEYKTFIIQNTSDMIQFIETYDSQDMDYIRVKYLDKEDIESLGFKYHSEGVRFNNTLHYYRKNNIGLTHNPKNQTISTFTFDLTKCDRCMNLTGIDANFIRSIIVKNKSELKKLLKQLNIK